MGKSIKYGIEPIYIKKEINNEKYKLLFGYIVSKCYVLDDNTVLFPYLGDNISYIENERTLSDAKIGFNTNYVDNIYDDYDSAKIDCDIKNKVLGINGYKRKRLKTIEKVINDFTVDIPITKKLIKK